MNSINTNNAALSAQRNLNKASAESSLNIARLSSGKAIVRAADDVSGLAIGTTIQTEVTALKTVLTSTSQANSLLNIADGGLENIGDILQRQKALSIQANSGTVSDNERAFLQEEFSNLTSEIDRIAASTNFNGIGLLDGSMSAGGNTSIATGVDETAASFFGTVGTGGATATGNYAVSGFAGEAGGLNTDLVGSFGKAEITAKHDGTNVTFNIKLESGASFSATVDDASVATATSITFVDDNAKAGETPTSFNVTVAAAAELGAAVSTQDGADTVADAMFKGLRDISVTQALTFDKGATPANSVTDKVDAANGTDFEGIQLQDITLNLTANSSVNIGKFSATGTTETVAVADNNILSVNINGTTFSANDLDDTVTSADTITLTAEDGSGQTMVIALTNIGASSFDATTSTGRDALTTALDTVLRGTETQGLDFQVGTASTDIISLSIDGAGTANLYKNDAGVSQKLDVSSAAGAVEASAILDNAIGEITSIRATVGALQSRFDYAAANVESSIQNQEAARSDFLDVDVAKESTEFASTQVRMQASISVLAQANQLPQNLLKLIG